MYRDLRDEFGNKNKIFIKVDGLRLSDRGFRNKGEAIAYLNARGYTRQDIARRVRFC